MLPFSWDNGEGGIFNIQERNEKSEENMVQVKDLEIGNGIPKICVPIVEQTQEQILNKAQEMSGDVVDLVEWRVDFYKDVWDFGKVAQTASLLQSILGKIPLLFTFRTAREGGGQEISFENYEGLLLHMAKSGCVDLIDVEVFRGYDKMQRKRKEWKSPDSCNQPIKNLIRELSKEAAVIGSYHDFEKTPSREEILRRLFFMDKMGAGILKLAVMPQEKEDVIRLMETTLLANRLIMDKPIITMSMGVLGTITRVAGETFGSAVTFGCVGKESAPGQIEAGRLRQGMEILHLD